MLSHLKMMKSKAVKWSSYYYPQLLFDWILQKDGIWSRAKEPTLPWLMPKHRKLLNSATAQRTSTVFPALLKYQYLSKLTTTNCQILFCADWHLTSSPLICHSSLLGFFSLFAPLYILCIASHSLSKNLMVIQYSLVVLILQLLCIWNCISILLSKQLLSFP